jgi:serine/threonine-protein kinase
VTPELQALDGRLALRGLLGVGGMGEVHRAWDLQLERAVAVKLLRGPSEREAERLLLEARLQARVEHPHVVKVHEVGTLGGRPCVVLQLVEGRTLARLAADLPIADRVELLRQAALGLHAAHQEGLVHRDVKPDNVLVEEGRGGVRTAFMSDFGLARAEEGGLSRGTLPGGTLDFMSPEQLVGQGPVDRRSDVYALGATLYAVLAGHPPFRPAEEEKGGAEGQMQVLRRILEDEPPPLGRLIAGLPRDLTLIASHAMEKEPSDRYPTAEAFGDDLARFQRGEPIRATRTGSLERAVKWVRRNRTRTRALLVAAAALVLAGAFALWSAREAGLAALEAARLGALAESMEANLRQEYLAPPHDLRSALARIRGQVTLLGKTASQSGPASFALGKGLELLGDAEGARVAYQRAWDAGFRSPRVAEGLGTVLGFLYRKAHERARETLAPEARAERVAALKAELRDPAERYLAQADAAGWRLPYLKASLAMLEGDWPSARARAAEALAADPGRYEARLLWAEAWIEEGRLAVDAQKFDDAEVALKQAALLLDEAERFGRSDPRIPRDRATMQISRAVMRFTRGEPPDEAVAAMLDAVAAAEVLDPDAKEVASLRGSAYLQKVQYAFLHSPQEVAPSLEQAALAYRRAVELDGGEPRTLYLLARTHYYRAFHLVETGGEGAVAAAREGLAAAAQAASRAPHDPDVPFVRCLLHQVEAKALERAGEPHADALRQAVQAGEEALGLKSARAMLLRSIMGQALVALAADDLRSGADPGPDLEGGLARLDEAYRTQPGVVAIAGQVASSRLDAIDVALALGQDARPHIARATAAVDEVLARQPDLGPYQALKGETLAKEALRRAAAGEDPTSTVAEAEHWLDRSAVAMGDDLASQLGRGELALSEALWADGRGRDPSGALARAERHYRGRADRSPEVSDAHEGLARCALVRARWIARRGGSPLEVARAGLASVQRALAIDRRDPLLFVLRARLEVLAGDRESARHSLESAWAVNPRVKASEDGQAALREVE